MSKCGEIWYFFDVIVKAIRGEAELTILQLFQRAYDQEANPQISTELRGENSVLVERRYYCTYLFAIFVYVPRHLFLDNVASVLDLFPRKCGYLELLITELELSQCLNRSCKITVLQADTYIPINVHLACVSVRVMTHIAIAVNLQSSAPLLDVANY